MRGEECMCISKGNAKKTTNNSKKSESEWAQIAVYYNWFSSKYKESQNDPNKAWKRQQKVKQVEQNKIHMK